MFTCTLYTHTHTHTHRKRETVFVPIEIYIQTLHTNVTYTLLRNRYPPVKAGQQVAAELATIGLAGKL